MAHPDDQALRRQQLGLLFSQVPGAVWTTNSSLELTHAEGRLMGAEGVRAKDLIGKTIYDFLGTRDPAEPGIAYHIAALQGKRQTFRHSYRGRMYEVVLEPYRSNGGVIDGCIGVGIDVTERQASEAALAREMARLAKAQRVAHIGSFEWDIDSDVVTLSDEMYPIYGLARGDFGGALEAFLTHVHPADLEHTKQVVFDACQAKKAFAYEHRIVRPDGTLRWLQTRGDVLIGPDGRVKRLVGTSWDITDQHEMREQLEQSVSLLSATLESTADGILVVDRDGHVVAFNNRFLALWKIPQDIVTPKDDAALLTFVLDQLEDPEVFLRRVKELYAQPAQESFDILDFKDGRIFERYSSAQKVHETIVGRVWSFRDVTERERLFHRAQFLSDAARLLSTLDVEKALDALAHLAVPYLGDGCAVDLLDMGGPRRLLAVSRDPQHPIAPELHRSVLPGHTTTYAVGHIAYLAVPLTLRDRVAGALTFAARPHRSYQPHEVDVAEELARRASMAFENARLYQHGQQALKARDEFLAVAGHEIRGPVTSIHMAASLLQKSELTPQARATALEVIAREDIKLSRFIEELLDLSQIQAGRIAFRLEPIDLGEVVNETVSRLSPLLAKSGSEASVTLEGDLRGTWDGLRLGQVVYNLLTNAIKFGRGRPIVVDARAQDATVKVTVRDQGIGIPPEKQRQIFEPFERAVSTRSYGGLGLGLFIVKTVIEGLGGSVTLQSEPDRGSTFEVSLPKFREVKP